MKSDEKFDIIIVGSGVTGYGAAMYAGRFNLKTLVLGDTPGGIITWTDDIANYPGFKKLSGQELADKLKEHALDYKEYVTIKDGKVVKIDKISSGFKVMADNGESYNSKTIVLATGTEVRKMGVPGETEFANKGVSYCALCDGAFFKNQDVAIVGGGDSAVKEGVLLTRYAKKVYVLCRSEKIRGEPTNLKVFNKNPKIELITNISVKEIKGSQFVEKLVLDREYNGSNELSVNGVFVAIGHIPLSNLAKDLGVEINKRGEIKINRNSETNVEGVFAAGDVVDARFKQAITGVAEGVHAVFSAYNYLREK